MILCERRPLWRLIIPHKSAYRRVMSAKRGDGREKEADDDDGSSAPPPRIGVQTKRSQQVA